MDAVWPLDVGTNVPAGIDLPIGGAVVPVVVDPGVVDAGVVDPVVVDPVPVEGRSVTGGTSVDATADNVVTVAGSVVAGFGFEVGAEAIGASEPHAAIITIPITHAAARRPMFEL